jgi:hypothetical protein
MTEEEDDEELEALRNDETVKARMEELRKKMPRVKKITIKTTYDLNTGELTVQLSPSKNFDAKFVLELVYVTLQWLSSDFVEKGLIKVPEREKPKYID